MSDGCTLSSESESESNNSSSATSFLFRFTFVDSKLELLAELMFLEGEGFLDHRPASKRDRMKLLTRHASGIAGIRRSFCKTMSASPNSGLSTGQVTPNESLPSTPRERFIPKRAMASFENLVALANHQERLKEAKKMVWRDKGQPVVEMGTLQECLTHAVSGGFSEFTVVTIHVFFYFIFHVFDPKDPPLSRSIYALQSMLYLPSFVFIVCQGWLTVAFKNEYPIKSFN